MLKISAMGGPPAQLNKGKIGPYLADKSVVALNHTKAQCHLVRRNLAGSNSASFVLL